MPNLDAQIAPPDRHTSWQTRLSAFNYTTGEYIFSYDTGSTVNLGG